MNNIENVRLESTANGEIRQDYNDLFQISPELREKMKGKSLALIFFESTLMSLELTNERGKLSLNSKRSSQEHMEKVIQDKIESYNSVVKNVVLPTIDVFASMLSAFGGDTLRGLFQGVTKVTSATSAHLGESQEAERTGYNHVYEGENQLLSQNRESQRESLQLFDRMLQLWKEKVQESQELFRTVSSAAAA
ncbi:MAG: hypothetical protein ACHQUC_02065 [Chlamydiales bacterium]